jgi:hypothetical protein
MYLLPAVLTALYVIGYQVWVSDYDLSALDDSFFQFFVVASPLAVCATIYLASGWAAHEKQSAATLESVQRNLTESHRRKEATSAAEIEQHKETIISEQNRISNFKKFEKDRSREIEMKSEVIKDLRHQLKNGNQRISEYSPAANIEDLVTLSEQRENALEAARQEIAELKAARDLAVVSAPALPVATAATDPAAPLMGEHQRLLAEKTQLENALQAETRKSERKDTEVAAKDKLLVQKDKEMQKLQSSYNAKLELAAAKEEQIRGLKLECDERAMQRQVEMDQKWAERMDKIKLQYDINVKAARS